MRNKALPVRVIVLQALMWGRGYCSGIAAWANKIASAGLTAEATHKEIKKLEAEGLIFQCGDYNAPGRGPNRILYKLTIEGRREAIQWRERVKMLYSVPPTYLLEHPQEHRQT